MTHLLMPPPRLRRPTVGAFLSNGQITGNNTTYTFTSVDFGAASAKRYLIVAIVGRAGSTSATLSSVTIGGVTASVIGTALGNGTTNQLALYGALVPSGTSGDIVAVFSAARNFAAYGLWALTQYESTAPVATYADTDSTMSGAISIKGGGFAVGAACTDDETSYTWTGLSENFDTTIQSNLTFTGASVLRRGLQTASVTVTASQAAGTDLPRMTLASFR